MSKQGLDGIRRKMQDDGQRAVLDEAIALGWTLTIRGSGHVVLYPPYGEGFMPMSTTKVGNRSTLNCRSHLNRWKKEHGIA